ncbi:MAG: hypothetical protein IGR76_02310 [Synechococcales cyanobacterium T60_A2020_003]|nr:hypothetical protein [Synechococcales cyanobacterium T60_A2020_003]
MIEIIGTFPNPVVPISKIPATDERLTSLMVQRIHNSKLSISPAETLREQNSELVLANIKGSLELGYQSLYANSRLIMDGKRLL